MFGRQQIAGPLSERPPARSGLGASPLTKQGERVEIESPLHIC